MSSLPNNDTVNAATVAMIGLDVILNTHSIYLSFTVWATLLISSKYRYVGHYIKNKNHKLTKYRVSGKR